MEHSKIFRALLNEAQFTKEILGIGVTQIRKANYAQKGIYYQSFTCLATGLERLGKICLLLNYYIDNSGTFPNDSYFKKHLGHNVLKIFDECTHIIHNKDMSNKFLIIYDDDIHNNILSILSDFGKGARYSNINILVGIEQREDSIKRWYEEVDLLLFEKHLTSKRKNDIHQRAYLIDNLLNPLSITRHVAEDGHSIDNIYTGSFRTGVWEAVSPYRQLYLLQIIRSTTILLSKLGHIASSLNNEDIPYFSEIFGLFYNGDSYFKSRKTWDRI